MRVAWISGMLLLGVLGGCSGSPAALQLITTARSGLDQAKKAEQANYQLIDHQLAAQAQAIDAAFDADVRQVAAGRLHDAKGNVVKLTGDWVIAARKGYAAAMQALQASRNQAQAAHLTRLDNLDAIDEALQMASELVVGQMKLNQTMRQGLLALQQRWIHGQ